MEDSRTSEFVQVGGARITQGMLERFFTLGYAKFYPLPDGYTPSLKEFGPHDGKGEPKPEQLAYGLLSRADMVGMACRACATSTPYVEPTPPAKAPEPPRTADPTKTLTDARFPLIAIARTARATEDRSGRAEAWASAYAGSGTPWLWVRGGSDLDRTTALARAAIIVADLMGQGAAPRGQIAYKHVCDLSAEVNSANQYGEDGRDDRLIPLTRCDLLMLDGIGEERARSNELAALHRIVFARWQNMRPTAFASRDGLRAWVTPYMDVDDTLAHDMADKVMEGLSGFAQGLSKAEAAAKASRHVIDLDAPQGTA